MLLEPLNLSSEKDVLELVRELDKAGEECVRRYRLIAERNELYVHGDQFADINPASFSIEDAWKPHLPRITQNHLRNIVNTWKARITKDRPSVTAWPTAPNPQAQASAQIAAKLIEYLEKELQIDLMLDDVVRLAGMHGVAGFKICYDPEADQIVWQRLSIFDFIIDPSRETYDDAKWCIFKTWIDKHHAAEMLAEANINEDPPVGTYKVGDSEEREGVEVIELWHKPTARIKQGLFCKVIGSHVLDSRPYPYIFNNLEDPYGKQEAVLPVVYLKVDYKRGSPYADTWLSDAIPEQRQINETEATLVRIRRETGNVKMIVPNNAVVQQVNTNSQIIVSPEGPGSIGYAAPPAINSLLFADREYHFRRLYDIAGLNEQLAGVENLKSGTSAKQIAYLSELDAMKHKGTAQSLETMLVRGWKLTLQLIQYYYINQRIMRIASDEGFDTVSFIGADIQGITVDLAPRTGLERFAATKAAKVETEVQAGWRSPAAALEARKTGSTSSIMEEMTRKIIQQQVKEILSGAVPTLDDDVEPVIAADELNRLTQLLADQVPPQLLIIIDQLKQAYQDKLMQQQQIPGE